MGLVWPLFAGLYFILKGIHWTLLAWWRTHGFKKERIRRRGDDVKRNLYFLYSQGTPIKEKRTRVLPFDYASVYIANGKIQFCFTRGRGELNVSLSPRHAPDDAYELAVVVAALDSKDITKLAQLKRLGQRRRFIACSLRRIKSRVFRKFIF
jgi:hypothetical protein